MADRLFPGARHWVRQSTSDLRAAELINESGFEATSRYLAQQAYEKALKAHCLWAIQGRSKDWIERFLRGTFFGTHAPLTRYAHEASLQREEERLRAERPDDWADGIKALRLVIRHAHAAVNNQKHATTLRQIDDTRPANNADVVSYRYPFFHESAPYAPSDWTGWDDYQGAWSDVVAAVGELQEYAAISSKSSRR